MRGSLNLDVSGVPLVAESEEEPPNLPYKRSGTQIFAAGNGSRESATEEIDEPIDLEQLWKEYEDNPNFFKEITLAQDGGMSEADELVGTMRYITATMTLSFVFINAWSIFSVNAEYIWGGNDDTKIFLVSKYALAQLNGTIPGVGAFIKNDLAIIGLLETAVILVSLIKILYWLWIIIFPGSVSGRWVAVQELFWNAVPEAGVISSLRLLYYVTPSVLLPAMTAAFTTAGGPVSLVCNVAWFVFTRGLGGLVGFDAFLFKTQTVCLTFQQALLNSDGDEIDLGELSLMIPLLTTAVAYLNQTLGVVNLNWFVRKRIFGFIFAGEDGQMSEQEEALKECWESMLAQRIWQDLPPHQALVTYLSYSDYDFQKLALETVGKPEEAKKKGKGHDARMKLRAVAALKPDVEQVEMATKGS